MRKYFANPNLNFTINKQFNNIFRYNKNLQLFNFTQKSLSANKMDGQTVVNKITQNKMAIVYAISSFGFFFQGYAPVSLLAAVMSCLYYFKSNSKIEIQIHNFLDKEYTKTRNNKIIYAVDEIKKYIFKHPELKRYFPENKSSHLHCITWVNFNQNSVGAGYVHEDKLSTKRWEISAEIINEEQNSHGVFQAIVLFHSPTHFVIEYLRVDVHSPINKRTTIIDGRRDMKEWVEELSDDKINKRMYPQFRPDEKVKY